MKCYISGGSWIEVRPAWIKGYYEVYKFSRLFRKAWYLGVYNEKMQKLNDHGPAVSFSETIEKFYKEDVIKMHAEIHQLTKWKYLVDVYNDQGDRELARTCKTLREALAFAKAYTTEIKYFRVGVFERYIC